MATKQLPSATVAPDGSDYVCLTDGVGNLIGSTGTLPSAATPVTISAAGTTAATAATLPAVAGKTTYLAGFSISSDATAATVVSATVSGVISGTMTFRQSVGAVASATATTNYNFNTPIPASAVNTPIVVTSGAAGAGGVTNVNAWGYQL